MYHRSSFLFPLTLNSCVILYNLVIDRFVCQLDLFCNDDNVDSMVASSTLIWDRLRSKSFVSFCNVLALFLSLFIKSGILAADIYASLSFLTFIATIMVIPKPIIESISAIME